MISVIRENSVPETDSPGNKKRCHGADGEDLVLKVPEGTVIREKETGKVIVDMSHGCTREVILKGGRGGKGNSLMRHRPCRFQNTHSPVSLHRN